MKVCRLCRHYAPGAMERCPRDGGELVEGPVPPVAPGEEVGPYLVGRALAAGQSGVLLLVRKDEAEEGSPDRLIKVLNPFVGPVDARRPVLESVLELSIEGLQPIDELLEEAGRLCLVREVVAGTSLAVRLKLEGPLDQEEAVGLGRHLCRVAGEVHDAGLQHHDIRPGHLLIPEGEAPRSARLLDLGSPSPPGAMSAPELHQGRGGVEATDVYGICMTLYVALAGRSPFRADAPDELAWMVRSAPPPPLKVVRKDASVDPALEQLVMWGLSKDPRDRPDLEKVSAVLEALAEGEAEVVTGELEGAPSTALPPRAEPPPEAPPVDEAPPEVSAVAEALREKALLADGENPTMRIVRKILPKAILKPTGLTQSFFVEGEEMEREVARAAYEEALARQQNVAVWLRFLAVLIVAVTLGAATVWILMR